MTAKVRTVLYLDAATAQALADYQARHRRRFPTLSAAGNHLVGRAVLGEVDEGLEGLLAPAIARRVEEAAARAVEAQVAPLLRAQTDRLAGLLVKSGKDARSACVLGEAILAQLTGDPAAARRLAEDARSQAGPAYTARALRDGAGS